MEAITLIVGSVHVGSGDARVVETRQVEFEGERLAIVHHTGACEGQEADKPLGLAAWAIAQKSRAKAQKEWGPDSTETLYRTSDGRLLVYVQDWSHFKDGPAVYTLHEATQQDVCRTGRYARLGEEAGFWRAEEARVWGPEGPICQACGTTLARSAMPTTYDGEEPVYLCWDCEKSSTVPSSR
jgi:hypothetical protein